MQKLFFLGVCLVVLGSSPVLAQTGGPEVVTVKVNETDVDVVLIVTRSTGNPEVYKYTRREVKGEGAVEAATQKVLAKLYQEGYSLKGSFGGGLGTYLTRNTLIFTKER